ncbi:MAG: prolipoprotein diacylglyceryl transferase [Paludibacter sp.]|jgi:prolipoprotein diacylglyceryl transferase|nr:prolipoprotein diacylglyceryl transferase [Paludibacter sp.]
MNLLSITWNVNPEIFHIGFLSIRWYGLLWATGILAAYLIIRHLYRHEKLPELWMDKLFIYGVLGVIIGARLGHCLFYEWHDGTNYYLTHPWALLYIWQGGLSSHGGAIGLIIAFYLYSRNVTHKGFLWGMDRLVIGAAITATCIRFGNLMNSEIYGEATKMPWGFIFVRDGQTVPMHPTQIYEMLYCLAAFGVTWWMYWKKQSYKKPGRILGAFLLIVFVTRFLLEFIKNNQESFEQGMSLNMGQLLSVPFIIWGLWLLLRKPKQQNSKEIK